ncbi:MAG: sulfotransferase family protein [Anaerolineae bacterium]
MTDEVVLPYEKDSQLESLLWQVNEVLHALEVDLVQRFESPRYPVVFIGGTQRSGTTLAIQLMRACFKVGYVSNLMARFWMAPYIGALLQKELQGKRLPREVEFVSELGTTYGYEGIHEFGFFWQRWFPYNETHQTSERDMDRIDYAPFRRELAAMESVFNAPLVFKNPIVFSLNIPALARLLPTAVFIVCRRDPRYVAQSTLLSRLEYHGQKEQWFSIKPKEFPELKDLPYEKQIAGQIYYTEKRIDDSLRQLDNSRYIVVEYRDLCQSPEQQMERVWDLVAGAGYRLSRSGFHPAAFENRNIRRIEAEEFQCLEMALAGFDEG